MLSRAFPVLVVLGLSLAAVLPAHAGKSLTLYLDGSLVERDVSARKGYLEIPLPVTARSETLRIRPSGGSLIKRVQVIPREITGKIAREIASVTERQALLQDRLKALESREEVFKAAAKSQSGKTPRRTKTNPEPLSSIRQGTDFALTQLEGVYQAQRKAAMELKKLEQKLVQLKKDGFVGGTLARVWVSPVNGRVTASYRQTDPSWVPVYEIRTYGNDRGILSIFPGSMAVPAGESVRVTLSSLEAASAEEAWPVIDENTPLKILEGLPVRSITRAGITSGMTVSIGNTSGVKLPEGTISCYRDGEYLGVTKFPGLSVAASVDVVCGAQ